jgi:hypothetical protein
VLSELGLSSILNYVQILLHLPPVTIYLDSFDESASSILPFTKSFLVLFKKILATTDDVDVLPSTDLTEEELKKLREEIKSQKQIIKDEALQTFIKDPGGIGTLKEFWSLEPDETFQDYFSNTDKNNKDKFKKESVARKENDATGLFFAVLVQVVYLYYYNYKQCSNI